LTNFTPLLPYPLKGIALDGYERIEKSYTALTPMTTADLFSTLRNLPRAEKLKVMQFLIAELAKEEPTLHAGATYSLWSPLNSHEAAHKLGQLLEADRRTQNA
jgi:hypothetical protein